MTIESFFRSRFAATPAGVWSAPGRVNLIGEHTDYTGGLVLPFAIDFRARVAIARSADGAFRVVSAQRRGGVMSVASQGLTPGSPAAKGWAAYPLGVVWAMRDRGVDVPPLEIALDSDVPAGAGLSSSAAVECSVTLAISDLLELGLDRPALARIAQRAENEFVGVPCGLMDQMASSAAIAGHALFFDVGADTVEQIPFDPAAAGLVTLVIDTRAHHSLADGEYAKRRAECEQAAAMIGVPLLSQVPFVELDSALARLGRGRPARSATRSVVMPGEDARDDDAAGQVESDASVLRRRVRHVITENERVRSVVAALRSGDIARIGPEISASHRSLRDDFEVSCAELDLAAQTAEDAGALGARMIGGGFGGSVIALAPVDRARAIADSVIGAFGSAGYRPPTVRSVTPADGARRDA